MSPPQNDFSQPLSACVLSGGLSRRMGRDKALLPHQQHSTWLEHISALLLQLGLPVQVLTRHKEHLGLQARLPTVTVQLEPEPWRGPLQGMARVLPHDENCALFTAPVDMPRLQCSDLKEILWAWQDNTDEAVIASDGDRLQPLLGIYPGGPEPHRCMLEVLHCADGRWMDWLEQIPYRSIKLRADRLLNCNWPEDLKAVLP